MTQPNTEPTGAPTERELADREIDPRSWRDRPCCRHAHRMVELSANPRQDYFICARDGRVSMKEISTEEAARMVDAQLDHIEETLAFVPGPTINAPVADPINPPHYAAGGIEAINVIEAFGLGFHLGNALKYLLRAGRKGDALEDLRKASWYVTREIERREREESDGEEDSDGSEG